ncbi:high-affinity branched-chain amino acid ABC transporter ATP-binding protein LivG [Oceanospirillum linum]|uniref:High-affinity branched-chain amino acid ABC transporter ATP-binding protein LivG n=1 Tax=Oceanospirillum linum TaxID=966 RepID=A0A1T1HDY3_OCELI|nr:high-affinity branched-chain amino acid ABC transporter ATP-binding protein LivG [Oceanospirillum linum]OOV88064.1 high-affinity branched-chain amino acid ABC transporter ATP-binding protein LivG [Oceanospirillum linum]SEF41882.1 L-leucine ABC transporter ATP-binding protein /L-isoleucine ABC transporter ATP-binding protein /L-valine ABC transporter ATP-binding protein [Oleiphilus messinensis]SMP00783.1 L-leucine ABC transporter ATP-binding protein /L-isoleucine ABC transporter ATP-binding pr
MTNNLLTVKDLTMRFGGLLAVNGVDLEVKEKQIVSVIGPNGAGKTTVFNCVSGFYIPTAGSVIFQGKELRGKPGHLIAREGMVRTFQNVRLFKEMTVIENLLVAQHMHAEHSLLKGFFMTPGFKKSEQELMDRAAHWLERVGLLEFANREAGNLAYGQQRRLEIARCMVTEPKLLMLDEPAAGLNPNETKALDELIVQLRDEQGISILLIEHDMGLVMGISDQIYVVNQGEPLAAGTPAEIQGNPEVIKAYLGEE